MRGFDIMNAICLLLVPLGSIPELPAQSCREIKASEGEHAVSGSYWIELIHLGKIIYAECDMETEGKLPVRSELTM